MYSNGDEDELHLLFICTAYADIRLKYNILNAVVDQPSENHVHNFLGCKGHIKPKTLSKHVAEAMSIRKKKLQISQLSLSNVVDCLLETSTK